MELVESSCVRPRQALYQAALRPDSDLYSSVLFEIRRSAEERCSDRIFQRFYGVIFSHAEFACIRVRSGLTLR